MAEFEIDFFGGELLFLARLKPYVCVTLNKLLKVPFDKFKVGSEVVIHFFYMVYIIETQAQ
jgi:hypothetical protein